MDWIEFDFLWIWIEFRGIGLCENNRKRNGFYSVRKIRYSFATPSKFERLRIVNGCKVEQSQNTHWAKTRTGQLKFEPFKVNSASVLNINIISYDVLLQ